MENQQTPVVPTPEKPSVPQYTIPSHLGKAYVPYVPYQSSYQMPVTIPSFGHPVDAKVEQTKPVVTENKESPTPVKVEVKTESPKPVQQPRSTQHAFMNQYSVRAQEILKGYQHNKVTQHYVLPVKPVVMQHVTPVHVPPVHSTSNRPSVDLYQRESPVQHRPYQPVHAVNPYRHYVSPQQHHQQIYVAPHVNPQVNYQTYYRQPQHTYASHQYSHYKPYVPQVTLHTTPVVPVHHVVKPVVTTCQASSGLVGYQSGDPDWEFLKKTQEFIEKRGQIQANTQEEHNFDEIIKRYQDVQFVEEAHDAEPEVVEVVEIVERIQPNVEAEHDEEEVESEKSVKSQESQHSEGEEESQKSVKSQESQEHSGEEESQKSEEVELQDEHVDVVEEEPQYEENEVEEDEVQDKVEEYRHEFVEENMEDVEEEQDPEEYVFYNKDHSDEKYIEEEEQDVEYVDDAHYEPHEEYEPQFEHDEEGVEEEEEEPELMEYNEPGDEMDDDENEGFVNEYYDNGAWYEGCTRNGKRHGKGKFFYKAGGVYDGQWENGKINGIGTLYYASGDIAYHGQWKDEMFNGRGVIYNDNPQINDEFDYTDFSNLQEMWEKYQGDFKSDAKDGIGTLYLVNGDRFFGTFSDDQVHGKGKYTVASTDGGDSVEITGEWENNVLVKQW